MIIICPFHGPTEAVMVAPDVAETLDRGLPPENLIVVGYECMGDLLHSYFLSPLFASQHGIARSVRVELPDDYPPFVFECKGYCRKCFEDKTGMKVADVEASI